MAEEAVKFTFKLDWHGEDVSERTGEAVQAAMNDTTAAAAIFSKGNHPGWNNVTGTAEGSIRGDPARKDGDVWRALFGSFDVNYFIWLEIGTRFHEGDNTIRRGADAEFPKLAERIAKYLQSELDR
jgi:hypothetical protein